MEISRLRERPEATDASIAPLYTQFQTFLDGLRKRTVPPDILEKINGEVEALNAFPDGTSGFKTKLQKAQMRLVRLVEQKLKIVPKNYYRKLWLVLGMSVFGMPFGVIYGLLLKNMGMMAIGLPIGMGMGTLLGTFLDKKALEGGRQLDVEFK